MQVEIDVRSRKEGKWDKVRIISIEEFREIVKDRIFQGLAEEEYKSTFPIRKKMTAEELDEIAEIVAHYVMMDIERLVR